MSAEKPGRNRVSRQGNPNRLGSITRRIVYTLALFPIITTASIASVGLLEDQLRLSWFDELRCFNSFAAMLWVTGMLVIWRRGVVWTPRRKWLTTLACMIPFLQVVYGKPWWTPPSTGWLDMSDLGMRVGQGQIGIGLWLWLTTWIWWGTEDAAVPSDARELKAGSVRIESTGRRIVVCFAMLPLQIGCYILLFESLESFLGPNKEVPVSMSLIVFLSVAAWIMIWRRAVIWTSETVWQTTWLTVALLGLPLGAQFIFSSGAAEGPVVVLTVICWGLWMMITVSTWPMVERIAPDGTATPRCLRCGYLLTGLTSTRCPECGDEPTIDALWQATNGEL